MQIDKKYLDEIRFKGDPEADLVVEKAFKTGQEKTLYHLLRGAGAGGSFIADFLNQSPYLPPWYDEARLIRGQRFFKKFALEIMTLLGALSLPYCYAASPGNKALYLTGKMQQNPGRRLHDTARFIIAVLEEGSFANGTAELEVNRTRLIHGLVRKHVSAQPQWNMAWGVPVNQEDMAGTNLAFSHIVLNGLERLNFRMNPGEMEDFLHAWRFIGYQLRIEEALLPDSIAAARRLEKTIKERHFKLSEEARLLTRELLQHYRESFPAPAGYLIESQVRYFVGPEVSILLGLRQHPFRDRIIAGINHLQQKINYRFVNPNSYDIMMKNHNEQKKKYSPS